MKKIYRSVLLSILLAITFMLAGCGDSPGKVDENIRKATINSETYQKDGANVTVPRIALMKDESLQNKINTNVKESILSLMKKGDGAGLEGEFTVMFMNDRLLVILFDGNNFLKDENGNTLVQKAIHVDLTSGKVYDPVEIFKDKNYAEKLMGIARDGKVYGMYDESFENWQYSLFKTQWEKKNNHHMALTEKGLWIYALAVDDEGVVPGYTLPYSEIDGLLNKDSNLWKAFSGNESRASGFDALYFAGLPFQEEMDEETARRNANEMMQQMMAAEAKEKAAYAKGKTDAEKVAAQKAAAQRAAAQKAAAQKAAAQKAAAKKGNIFWKTTKVETTEKGIIVYGTYRNTFTNRTMLRTNWNTLTLTYKNAQGQVRNLKTNYTKIEKVIPPGKTGSVSFRMNIPQGYTGKYIKIHNQFSYGYR